MKKPLLVLFLFGTMSIFGQSTKSKNIKVAIPSYAKKPVPQNVNTYMGAFANSKNAALPFTEEAFKNALKFQDFTKLTDENGTPDFLFALNGLSIKDLNLTISRSKANETYSVSIVPKADAAIGILTMLNGESVHYNRIAVLPKADSQGTIIPVVLDFTFEEEEKYLTFANDEQAKGTPYLVEEYLRVNLGDNFLTETLAPVLYEDYDIRANTEFEKFYFIKDKKTEGLEDETKAKVADFEEMSTTFTNLEQLRAGKEQLHSYKTYWEEKLAAYDLSSKTGKKAGWGLIMNLYNVALMQEDFEAASKYMEMALETEEKKWITRGKKNAFDKHYASYVLNYDKDSGERIYSEGYTVDPILAKIAKKEAIQGNNVDKAVGYVIKDDGEKMEGKISMRFSPQEQEGGNIMDVSGDTTAKRVTVTYVNAKGKTKNASLKCKEVSEIVIEDRVFEPVNPKKGFIKSTEAGLSGFNLNSTIFMQRVFVGTGIKLFKDLTDTDTYYFSIDGVKKAETASAEFFASCPALAGRIEGGEFSTSEEDQIKIAKAYSNECK
ncbi:hypothetical protein SAMN04488007_1031 [Maribacter aquivivus]|uniref:Uncharacterized protein n=1 Tax=Maribacter aquivivus TaxID=228958 RepID=A0A1M6L5C8_9FLAO|nr:hypothetical protein [Maribacter aquivivus]SHJ66403.1 hypothetical protein SAMN04488007_1031 [Maribacter aquivivus]